MHSRTLPASLASTRHALHRVAEHVVSPARHAVTGRIGLRPAPGGFTTPSFGDDGRTVAVEGVDIVVRDSAGERRAPLTTIRAAAEYVGVEPGAPADVYTPSTPLDPDAPLDLDPEAAALLAEWYATGQQALSRLAEEIAEDKPSEAQLWPEHFDLGITAAAVNYGVSPGDEHVVDPYLYVGPHGGPPGDGDEFWNAPFGAVRTIHDIGSVDDAVAFFRAGRERAHRAAEQRRSS